MSRDEQSALNRRVAQALGWRWFLATVISEDSRHRGQQHPLFMSPQDATEERGKDYYDLQPCEKPETVESWRWGDVPNYCTDPAAADLVEAWFEADGWRLIQDFVPVCGGGKHWLVKAFKQDSIGRIEEESRHSRKVALCLAFLAAHDAQQEQEAKP